MLKISERKQNVTHTISFDDYVKASGMSEELAYHKLVDDGEFEWESDGDFIKHINLASDSSSISNLKKHLPEEIILSNKLGVEFSQ